MLVVTRMRQELERLEREGRGHSGLYIQPTSTLHRSVIAFDDIDYPIVAVNDFHTTPDDADVVFLEFGPAQQHAQHLLAQPRTGT